MIIKPLDFGIELSLKEAEERCKEVRTAFEEVSEKYSGVPDVSSKRIDGEDYKTLEVCFGVVLVLSTNTSVRENPTLLSQISKLIKDIPAFLARFENTGT